MQRNSDRTAMGHRTTEVKGPVLDRFMKRRRLAFSTLLAAILGCGGSSEPNIPESAQLLLEAQKSIAAGDNAAALTALQASIDSEPTTWAYLERIKLNGKQGNDVAVEEDVQAILKLDPEHKDVAWIRTEMKKPATARFDASATPPSARK
jgi:hypothetical protein